MPYPFDAFGTREEIQQYECNMLKMKGAKERDRREFLKYKNNYHRLNCKNVVKLCKLTLCG